MLHPVQDRTSVKKLELRRGLRPSTLWLNPLEYTAQRAMMLTQRLLVGGLTCTIGAPRKNLAAHCKAKYVQISFFWYK